jgi:hypothetical protein
LGSSAKKINMIIPKAILKVPGYHKKRSFPGIDPKGFREQFRDLEEL